MYIRDRWGNYSDTVIGSNPWFEEFIPKNTWRDYTLAGDIPPVNANYPITRIWDNNYDQDGFHGMETQVLPHNLT